MSRGWRYLCIGVVAGLAACASTAENPATTGGDRAVLGVEELRTDPGRTLEDVIRRRRPQWLTGRGVASLEGGGEIVVYQDGVRIGGPEVLGNVTVSIVESVRYLSAAEATTRFGTGHTHGALLIVTRSR